MSNISNSILLFFKLTSFTFFTKWFNFGTFRCFIFSGSVECPESSGEIQSTLNWIVFDFDDISVTPDSTYYIIIRTNGGNNFDAYEWGFGYYNPYNRGSFWRSINSGSSWTEYTYYDFCLKTYGI